MSLTTGLGFRPSYTMTKGGEEVSSALYDRCTSITIESCSGDGANDTCDIVLDDRDWSIGTPSLGDNSKPLTVNMGYTETGLFSMGTYTVDQCAYIWMPKSIRLHGNAVSMDTAAKSPIVASYDGQTLGDVVGAIAGAMGVNPIVSEALTGIAIPYLNQHSSSMHLLQNLESRFDGMAKVEDGNLTFTKRDSGLSVSGVTMDTFTLGPEDFGGGEINCSNRDSYTKVRASYWDKIKNELAYTYSTGVGGVGATQPYLIKRAYPSQVEAQNAADAAMSSLNRRYKTGNITLAKGHPGIRGGAKLTISGCRDGVNDTYIVETARHTFTKDGGIQTGLSIHSTAGDDADPESVGSDGLTDTSGIPATSQPSGGGVGHQ